MTNVEEVKLAGSQKNYKIFHQIYFNTALKDLPERLSQRFKSSQPTNEPMIEMIRLLVDKFGWNLSAEEYHCLPLEG